MDPGVVPLQQILRLNSRLLLNCFDGVDDETARTRPRDGVNSMAFVALHLHDARHYLAEYLGVETPDPFQELTASARGIEDVITYPSLAEMRAAWLRIAAILERRLATIAPDELAAPSPAEAPDFPVADQTVLGGVAFLLQHEAHHIGQLSLLRKCLGLPSLSWKL